MAQPQNAALRLALNELQVDSRVASTFLQCCPDHASLLLTPNNHNSFISSSFPFLLRLLLLLLLLSTFRLPFFVWSQKLEDSTFLAELQAAGRG